MAAAIILEPEAPLRGASLALAWTLQFAGLALFAMSGAAKLTDAPAMVALFDAIEIGQWFRYATGGLEIVAAVLLMVPSRAGIGAALLSAIMAGAVLTHLVVLHTSPALPAGLLVAMLTVAWLRREPLIWLAREYGLITDRAPGAQPQLSSEATS